MTRRQVALHTAAKLLGPRRTHELKIRWSASRRIAPPRRLVAIVSSSRCGGHLLIDYLNSVPRVSIAGEVLNPKTALGCTPSTPESALRHVRRSLWSLPGDICGAKFTFKQLEDHGLGTGALLALQPEPLLIVLYRRSLGHAFVSHEVARQTNQWHRRGNAPAFAGTVRIESDAYRTYAGAVRRDYEALLASPASQGRMRVIAYEDLAAHPQQVFDDILLPFLEVPATPVSTILKKQIERPLDVVVENYADVRALLEGEEGRQDYPTSAHGT